MSALNETPISEKVATIALVAHDEKKNGHVTMDKV